MFGALSFASFGARYQTILGVPILVKNVEITSHDSIDERAITDLAAFLKSDTGIDQTNELQKVLMAGVLVVGFWSRNGPQHPRRP